MKIRRERFALICGITLAFVMIGMVEEGAKADTRLGLTIISFVSFLIGYGVIMFVTEDE